jgi:hypothetical protein
MIYSMNLYYNYYVLELFGHEFRTNKNINALKFIFCLLVYSSFLIFIVSFQYIKLQKYTKLF